jgi:glucosamine-6-phosphate deaminase
VPGPHKAAAVAATLDGPITTSCPASALRRHADAVLFADPPAMSMTAG